MSDLAKELADALLQTKFKNRVTPAMIPVAEAGVLVGIEVGKQMAPKPVFVATIPRVWDDQAAQELSDHLEEKMPDYHVLVLSVHNAQASVDVFCSDTWTEADTESIKAEILKKKKPKGDTVHGMLDALILAFGGLEEGIKSLSLTSEALELLGNEELAEPDFSVYRWTGEARYKGYDLVLMHGEGVDVRAVMSEVRV